MGEVAASNVDPSSTCGAASIGLSCASSALVKELGREFGAKDSVAIDSLAMMNFRMAKCLSVSFVSVKRIDKPLASPLICIQFPRLPLGTTYLLSL